MAIEADAVEILSGVRRGVTLGSPIALLIRNRDWANWEHTMSVTPSPSSTAAGARRQPVSRPRPGHADLAGALKYGHDDLRNVLERASARETAARVALGTVARQLLAVFDVGIASHVVAIGGARAEFEETVRFERVLAIQGDRDIRCVDSRAAEAMRAAIDLANADGDTLGGVFEVIAHNVPPGLGSYVHWDRRLDGRLGQALLSIPAVKAVSLGDGVAQAARRGSAVHDPILPASRGVAGWGTSRPSNNAGGLEGGVSNGEDIRATGWMKPIATLMRPLASVDLESGTESPAAIERSDTCAVPAAAVVGEAVVASVLADAFTEKFGSDSLEEIERNYASWKERLGTRFRRPPPLQ
jgi:chorismate synthase